MHSLYSNIFGFIWGQSYAGFAKKLRKNTQRPYFFSRLWATFIRKSTFWATFWEITGTFLGNLKQLVESPIWGCAPKEKFEIFIALTLRGQGCRQQLHCTYPNLPIGAGWWLLYVENSRSEALAKSGNNSSSACSLLACMISPLFPTRMSNKGWSFLGIKFLHRIHKKHTTFRHKLPLSH